MSFNIELDIAESVDTVAGPVEGGIMKHGWKMDKKGWMHERLRVKAGLHKYFASNVKLPDLWKHISFFPFPCIGWMRSTITWWKYCFYLELLSWEPNSGIIWNALNDVKRHLTCEQSSHLKPFHPGPLAAWIVQMWQNNEWLG